MVGFVLARWKEKTAEKADFRKRGKDEFRLKSIEKWRYHGQKIDFCLCGCGG